MKEKTKTHQGFNHPECVACPAGLLCLQNALKAVYLCRNCKRVVVYFLGEFLSDKGDIRTVVTQCPEIVENMYINSCYECARKFDDSKIRK